MFQQTGCPGAYVPESLDRVSGSPKVEVSILGPLLDRVNHALAGSLIASLTASRLDRLAGDHVHVCLPFVRWLGGNERIDDPGHNLGIGVYIRSGDIIFRPDITAERERKTAGYPLHLGAGAFRRIELNPALCAAKGNVGQGSLPGHPGGQCAHLLNVHRRVEAQPTLVRAQGVVMLYPVPGEHLDPAVVHLDREIHYYLVGGFSQDPTNAGIKIHQVGRLVELLGHIVIDARPFLNVRIAHDFLLNFLHLLHRKHKYWSVESSRHVI